jgi:hypothetical protein
MYIREKERAKEASELVKAIGKQVYAGGSSRHIAVSAGAASLQDFDHVLLVGVDA